VTSSENYLFITSIKFYADDTQLVKSSSMHSYTLISTDTVMCHHGQHSNIEELLSIVELYTRYMTL